MWKALLGATAVASLVWSGAVPAWGQGSQPVAGAVAAPGTGQPGAVTCTSGSGERQHCVADTSQGVALARSTGAAPCLLGKNWGYDDQGIWVSDGCGGEFLAGRSVPASTMAPGPVVAETPADTKQPTPRIESWGEFEPGDGFLLGRSSAGELSISGYALVRYINQLPAEQTFEDHLGNEQSVDARQDFFSHREMIFLKGWLGTPKLVYTIFFWTVNTTDQKNIFGSLGYQFSRKFSLYMGINGLPGTRSLQGSHPFWLAHDRVMADEFFRPFFTHGIWAQGEVTPGFWYNVMVGNNLSALGIKASQLDRKISSGASVWWMPTTKEFGPKGAYGDFEMHEKVATRFGVSTTYSPEQRFTDSLTGATGNTTIRLVDSVNVFDTGALAPGVTVQDVNYRLISIDAGMKYRGVFLQTELYSRHLDGFKADGALPVKQIDDTGFYVQASFFPVPRMIEAYVATSQIFGDTDAGFDTSSEYLAGLNYYPFNSRNYRANLQVIDVHRSAVSSTFGYYTGGQDGTTVSLGFSVFF
ncbi:MAG: DUF3011 domain-containing protein [Thermoanaerobaculaceae bacterium]|jgi:hypothetical protein|nr:DUF3011 domain-containing protein [Thermoanaerobaculaceae bacterium]